MPLKVLITGASSGIGAALARHMAARGDSVWLAARRLEKLQQIVDEIRAAGGEAHAVELDVQNADALEGSIAALDAEAGGFDVVVANAGIGGNGATASGLRWPRVKQVFEIDFVGAVATLLAAQRLMIERRRGQLVAVSSLAAEVALPIALDYGAAKAALSYFVEAMRYDLLKHGVHVTLVHPGFVKSELTDKNKFPMPFILDAEDAAERIARAIDKKSARLRFPFIYAALLGLARLLPLSIVGPLALRQTKAGPSGMPRLDD